MKNRFKGKKFRWPLGRKHGRYADKNYRWAYGRQCESRLAEDYRTSMKGKDNVRLERFGEAGILAKQFNNNPILKDLWKRQFNKNRRTRRSSVFNLLSRKFYRELKGEESSSEGAFLREFRGYRRITAAPDGRFTAGAEIYFNGGDIIAEPNGKERYNGLTGVILFWKPKKKAGRLLVKESKCKDRNKELSRIEEVRVRRRCIADYRRLVCAYLKMLRSLKMRNAELEPMRNAEFGIRNKMQPEEQKRNAECGVRNENFNTQYVICNRPCKTEVNEEGRYSEEELLGLTLDKTEYRYVKNVCAGMRELMDIDYLPTEDECFEAEWALQDADRLIVEEHYRMKEAYRSKPVKKYMEKRICTMPVYFEKGEAGSYYLVNTEEVKEAAEGFKNYFIYMTFYRKDEAGLAEYWSDGFYSHGKTEAAEVIKIIAAVYILVRYIEFLLKVEIVQRE